MKGGGAGGERQQVSTSDDARFYAFLRGAADGERALAVFNFQSSPYEITVNLGGQQIHRLEDLRSGEAVPLEDEHLSISLSGYGYKIYRVAAG